MRRVHRLLPLPLVLAFGACTPPPAPPPKPADVAPVKSVSPVDRLKRGEYLVVLAGCHDCHTPGYMYGSPDFARALSGSEMGWQGPWGVSYPRNLTPDMETGLGKWSEDDIVKAITTGRRPDGTELVPPMPVADFAHLTDEDAHAIAAYLKSIPAVQHRMPDRIAPGLPATGSVVPLPPPPPWDAPRMPQSGAPPATPMPPPSPTGAK